MRDGKCDLMRETYRGGWVHKVLGLQLLQGSREILPCCNTLAVGFLPKLPDFTWKAFTVTECLAF